MFTFLLKRFYQAVIVMFVISLVAFSIQDNLGDPLRELVGQSVSESVRQELRDKMGLNDPFLVKYSRFLQNAVQGDLGTSYFFKRPALEVILDKLVATLELVFAAALIIVVVSIPLGVYSAIRPRSILTKVIMAVSSIGISIPVFLTAIMLMYLFSIQLGWLPAYGRGETLNLLGWESGFFTWDGIKHLILPAVSPGRTVTWVPPAAGAGAATWSSVARLSSLAAITSSSSSVIVETSRNSPASRWRSPAIW
mgnify:CR=1 FL=1